jgi:PAS domain S-box-containing protein
MAPLPPALDSPQDGTLLAGERNVLELIATGATLPVVLDALCRVIDDQSGLTSSIYLLDGDGRQLRFAAGPKVPDAWRRLTASFAAVPTNGACGSAVTLYRPVVVENIASSPIFPAEWRAMAAAVGIASAWSTPFFSKDGRVLGTFVVLNGVSEAPTSERLHLVDRATRLASIVVEWHEAELSLRESEQRFSTAFYSSPASMAISRFVDGRLLYVNDRFVTHFGYARSEAIGRTSQELGLWADPGERDTMWRAVGEHGGVHGAEVKARTKSGAAMVVLLWLERIQILSEDCVLGIISDITERKRVERALAENERRSRTVLDTMPIGVTVIDRDGNIVLTNPASQRVWSEMISSGRERYARSKGWRHDTGQAIGPDEWPSARARLNGDTTLNEVVDIEAFDGVRKTVEMSAAPLRDFDERIIGAVFTLDDVSAQKKAERELHDSLAQMRALSGRLMRAQDDERRRIAQVLHETTAQDLAALKMLLARLSRTVGSTMSSGDRSALTESIDLAERSMTGVRTLSYLIHPPFLDETGLVSALRWYAEGFAERSGIAVDLDLPPAFERLDQDVETALFRVVQEALINVHRHAGSPRASIRLHHTGEGLTLEVEDRGHGMPAERLAQLPVGGGAMGVGIAGMRERLEQLGGTLEIESGERGTIVRARVPPITQPA